MSSYALQRTPQGNSWSEARNHGIHVLQGTIHRENLRSSERTCFSMSDWRLTGQEAYLTGSTLYKVVFPGFWKTAYRKKNAFFHMIALGAQNFVEQTGRGQEFLEGERVQHFWHEHCDFCWEKAETDKECTFYCTKIWSIGSARSASVIFVSNSSGRCWTEKRMPPS